MKTVHDAASESPLPRTPADAKPRAIPAADKPHAPSAVELAVDALKDKYVDRHELVTMNDRLAQETDPAAKAFLQTVATHAKERFCEVAADAPQGWLRPRAVPERVQAADDILAQGVVRAWRDNRPADDQSGARAKVNELVAALSGCDVADRGPRFYEALTAGAHLDLPGRKELLGRLAGVVRTNDEGQALAQVIGASRKLSVEDQVTLIRSLANNSAVPAAAVVDLIESTLARASIGLYPDEMASEAELHGFLLDARRGERDSIKAATAFLAANNAFAHDEATGLYGLAAKLLHAGASLDEVLGAWLETGIDYHLSASEEDALNGLAARLLTDVVKQLPGGVDSVRASANAGYLKELRGDAHFDRALGAVLGYSIQPVGDPYHW